MVSAQWRKNRPVQGPERAEKEGAHMYDTHIFLDFEMNPIPRECREARETARSEIVEIGAGRGRIYSWSRSDQYQLYDESWLKEAELPWQLNQRWIDFQAVYTRLIGLSRSNPLSLQNALGAAEYRFAGEAHRAVQDAENSASLLILVKEGRLAQQAGVVMQAMRPREEHSFALGGEAAEKLRQFLAGREQG